MWLIVASMIAGTWVGWEPLTGHKIPDYAHPVFATILAAALVWGGLDLRKVSYWHRKLMALPPEVMPTHETDRTAVKIASMETEDPLLLKAIQALALRDAGLPLKPKKTTGGQRRVPTDPGKSGVRAITQSGGASPRPQTRRTNPRNTPAPVEVDREE